MAGLLIVPGSWPVFDAAGDPVSGATINFYVPGTTTPKAVYSDNTLTTSLGSQLTTNSGGEPTTLANVIAREWWASSGQAYDIRIQATGLDRTWDGIPISTESSLVSIANITDLRAATWNGNRPTQAFLVNNWSAGDGGGTFRWDSASTATDNGGTIIKETATATGRWIRQSNEADQPQWFGATGTANDSAAFTALFATNPSEVYIPAGTYLLTPGCIQGASNQTVRGAGKGATILRAVSSSSSPLVKYTSKTNFHWSDITLDWNSQVETGQDGTVSIFDSSDWSFKHVEILNLDKFGFAPNWVRRFVISDCKITRAAKASTQNQAINLSSFSGQSEFGVIERNYCQNTAIIIQARNMLIARNFINGYSFGAGIVTEQDVNKCRNIEIIDNICTDGTGTDVNSYTCGGLEIWSYFTIVRGNICYSNDGAGIDAGGLHSLYDNNIFYDNGRGSTTYDGISARYGDATFNCSNSVFSNNKSFNQASASGPQAYGYREQSASLVDIRLIGNTFSANRTGPMLALSNTTSLTDPALQGSATWDPGSIANGAGQTTDITVTGARIGDMVQISFSLDLAGLTASGWVNASNNVKARLFNSTGGAIDLASGTVYATVDKRVNYAEYR
jgi:hypothetical protein